MTYRFQLAHLRVFQSYLERIYPSNDSGFDLIFFPIFFFNFRIPNHRSYVDCRKTKKRFAVHPSHYFPVKKLLKHVGTHLKSRLDAIQGSDYFRDRQTDRLTKAVHTHQHYVQIIPRFPLRGRRPPSPASGLCSPAANWPNQFFRPWGQVEKNLKYPSPFHLSASHLIIVILSPKQSNKMLESGGRMG